MKCRSFCMVMYVWLIAMSCTKKYQTADPAGSGPASGGAQPACSSQIIDVESMQVFPATNPWHADISASEVDPNSTQILSKYAQTGLHPDFGSGLYQGSTIGFPFIVVCANQARIPVVFRSNAYDGNYGDESDPGPYPIPLNAPIEQSGDAHVLAIDKDNMKLYELYNANVNGTHWEASSGAVFDLTSNAYRPDGWTSADAAGLPVFAGLIRYDEVANGAINHAVRFTLQKPYVLPAHILPARHDVNSTGQANASLPFGARLRLKAGFDISSYPSKIQVILKAFKKYGLILADIGSNMYISGSVDERWDNDELSRLSNVKASDFEVIKLN